jgi:hypothetical protein
MTTVTATMKRCINQRCAGYMKLGRDPDDTSALVYTCEVCSVQEFAGKADGSAGPLPLAPDPTPRPVESAPIARRTLTRPFGAALKCRLCGNRTVWEETAEGGEHWRCLACDETQPVDRRGRQAPPGGTPVDAPKTPTEIQARQPAGRDWELYTPAGQGPAITITRAGGISLNAASFGALGRPERVHLLFDRRGRAIGLRASDDGTGPRVLRNGGDTRGRYVNAGGFVERCGLGVEKAVRLPAAMEGDVLVAAVPG